MCVQKPPLMSAFTNVSKKIANRCLCSIGTSDRRAMPSRNFCDLCDQMIPDVMGYYRISVDERRPDPDKAPGHFKAAFPIDLKRQTWIDMNVLSPMVCRPCAEKIRRLMHAI